MCSDLKRKKPRTSGKKEFHARSLRAAGVVHIKGRDLVDFTNWDVFDLNSNPQFKKAVQNEIERSGLGAASFRTSSGTTSAHISCEKKIAEFFSADKALLYPSIDHAVFSVIGDSMDSQDALFYDEQIRLPVREAASLARLPAFSFNPSNLSTLEEALSKHRHAKRRYILLEHVSPIAGRKQDFSAILGLIERFDAKLIIDETFSLGVEGLRGAGSAEISGVLERTEVFIGDLSVIIPSFGAFVAGSAALIEKILERSKEFTEDTALPPALAAACEAALNILELAHADREKLLTLSLRLRDGLADIGFLDAKVSRSPIVSIVIGSTAKSREFNEALFQRGFFSDIAMLTTPYSEIGFARFIVGVFHTPKMIDDLLQCVDDVYRRLPPE